MSVKAYAHAHGFSEQQIYDTVGRVASAGCVAAIRRRGAVLLSQWGTLICRTAATGISDLERRRELSRSLVGDSLQTLKHHSILIIYCCQLSRRCLSLYLSDDDELIRCASLLPLMLKLSWFRKEVLLNKKPGQRAGDQAYRPCDCEKF